MIRSFALAGALLCLVAGLNTAMAETCIASQYGIGDGYHGRRTASGERFNTYAVPYTVAHKRHAIGAVALISAGQVQMPSAWAERLGSASNERKERGWRNAVLRPKATLPKGEVSCAEHSQLLLSHSERLRH